MEQPICILSRTGLDGINGFIIDDLTTTAGFSSNQFGSLVSGIGDINNDGFQDLFLNSTDRRFEPSDSYIIFGGSDIKGKQIFDVSTLNGENGFAIAGVEGIESIAVAS